MSISILIADDHDIIREGIKSILSQDNTYQVSGEAEDGQQVIEKARKIKPDILLLDISMPHLSGLDAVRQLRRAAPEAKIIIITMYRTTIYINKAFNLGVKGYLHKENVAEDLLPALKKVLRGETYISSKISECLVENIKDKKGQTETKSGVNLTEREQDILRLVVDGKTAKEIGKILFISSRTVENCKNSLMKKLNLSKTSDLIKYAIKHNLVDLE